MRDFDFDELDKAVNNFLTTKKISPMKDDNMSENTKKKMVFGERKAPKTASQLHSMAKIIEERNIDNDVTDIQEHIKDGSSDKPLKKDVKILDDFKDKAESNRRHNSKDVINDNLVTIEDNKFESPILPDYDSPINISGRHTSSISIPKRRLEGPILNKHKNNVVKPIEAKKNIENIGKVVSIEDTDKLQVFNAAAKTEAKTDIPNESQTVDTPVKAIKTEKIEKLVVKEEKPIAKFEKVLTEIGGSKPVKSVEDIAKELAQESKKEESEKISVMIKKDIKATEDTTVKEEKPESISIKVSEYTEDNDKADNKIEEIKIEDSFKDNNPINNTSVTLPENKDEEKVIIRSVENDTITKTPFVDNPKIEKRPLGNSASYKTIDNFNSLSRTRNINGISNNKVQYPQKNAISNNISNNKNNTTPLLAKEDYAMPVKYNKKKTGWGTVLEIITTLLLGIAGGLGVYFFFLK